MTTHPAARGPSALGGLLWIAVWGFSGFFFSYSTMVPISLDRGLSSVTGGVLLTTMMIGVIAIQPLAPALQRRWGPRRAVGGSLLLMAAGHGSSLVITHPVASLLVTGLAVGCGFGVLVVLATAAVPAISSPDRAGRALGLFGATTSAAAAVGAPLGLWLSSAVPLEVFRLVAVAAVLLGLLALTTLPARSVAPGMASRVASGAAPGAAHRRAPRASGSWWRGLAPVLLPFLVSMAAYGLVIAFGPGGDATNPALLIFTMQAASVVGRWMAGALTDRRNPAAVYAVGIVMTAGALCAMAAVQPGWLLAVLLVALGLGVGTVQSASLVMAFARAGTPGRASVGWNMSFDIGLGVAGVFGGLGFTYLGSAATFAGCGALMVATGLWFWVRGAR